MLDVEGDGGGQFAHGGLLQFKRGGVAAAAGADFGQEAGEKREQPQIVERHSGQIEIEISINDPVRKTGVVKDFEARGGSFSEGVVFAHGPARHAE